MPKRWGVWAIKSEQWLMDSPYDPGDEVTFKTRKEAEQLIKEIDPKRYEAREFK